MFKVGQIVGVQKVFRTAPINSRKKGQPSAPVNYDVKLLTVEKPKEGGGTKVLHQFRFTKDFIKAEQLDDAWRVSPEKGVEPVRLGTDGTPVAEGGTPFGELFALTIIKNITEAGTDLFFAKVRETYEGPSGIHAFGPAVKEGIPKAVKVVLNTATDFLIANGTVTGEVGEEVFFKLEKELGEDGQPYSDENFLAVYSLKKVEKAAKVEKEAAPEAPAPQADVTQPDLFSNPLPETPQAVAPQPMAPQPETAVLEGPADEDIIDDTIEENDDVYDDVVN